MRRITRLPGVAVIRSAFAGPAWCARESSSHSIECRAACSFAGSQRRCDRGTEPIFIEQPGSNHVSKKPMVVLTADDELRGRKVVKVGERGVDRPPLATNELVPELYRRGPLLPTLRELWRVRLDEIHVEAVLFMKLRL